MEKQNGEITNEFNLGDITYVWQIEGGLPILKETKVIALRVFHENVEYGLLDLSNHDDHYTMMEHNIFSSIENAIQVFNEGQDDLILGAKNHE